MLFYSALVANEGEWGIICIWSNCSILYIMLFSCGIYRFIYYNFLFVSIAYALQNEPKPHHTCQHFSLAPTITANLQLTAYWGRGGRMVRNKSGSITGKYQISFLKFFSSFFEKLLGSTSQKC